MDLSGDWGSRADQTLCWSMFYWFGVERGERVERVAEEDAYGQSVQSVQTG